MDHADGLWPSTCQTIPNLMAWSGSRTYKHMAVEPEGRKEMDTSTFTSLSSPHMHGFLSGLEYVALTTAETQ